MKQFALFCCEFYYPAGGWKDFVGTFEYLAVAKVRAKQADVSYGNWHVVDLHSGRIVASGGDPRTADVVLQAAHIQLPASHRGA